MQIFHNPLHPPFLRGIWLRHICAMNNVLKMQLPAKKDLKFALLGAGHHLCKLAQLLIERNFPKPVIVTHPKAKHERDRHLLKDSRIYTYLFDFANENKIDVIESPVVNKSDLIEKLRNLGCNAAFSLSCRSIIKKDFIDSFERRVLNIHPSFLPKERGGGTFSWRIMNNQKDVAATIHLVDEGIDTGPIVLQKEQQLNIDFPTPEDFMIKTNELYGVLLKEFLEKIETGRPIHLQPQNEEFSTYLPRLFTEINGAINWDWTAEEIERFIRAFSYPYPGAFTYVNNIRVAILEATCEKSNIYYHSYVSGRVTMVCPDGGICIAAKNGIIKVKKLAIDDNMYNPASIVKITDVFYTPNDVLFKARINTVSVRDMNPRIPKN